MTGDLEPGTLGGSGSPRWRRATSPRPPFQGGPLPGYAAALSGLSDAELHRLLERRPDLTSPPAPASFPELAGRAGTPASLAAALRTLDLGALRLAELLAVVGLPTTVTALAEAAGPGLDSARLQSGLATLAELGIALPGPDGTISGPPGLGAPFGRPGGLGPPVAELAKVGVSAERLERILANLGAPRPRGTGKPALVRAVSAALADPATVARAAAEADQDARRLLDEALASAGPITVMGVGYGRFAGYPDAEPANWLLERGLLLPVTYSQLVVPREAALGLRGGLVFPGWPRPPAVEPVDPVPDGPARAAAAATRAVIAAEGICARLDREPLPLVRAGTVAVRDLGRLARDLDLADQELALLVDLLVEARVLAVGGPFGQRSLGLRPEADAWLSAARSRRWADLAAAWRSADLAVEDHLVARDHARPLAGRRFAAAAARRRALLQVLVGAGGAGAAGVGGLARVLAWRGPMVWPDPAGSGPDELEATVRAMLDAAAFLGVAVVEGGRAQAGLAAERWLEGDGPAGLAEVAEAALPDGPDRFLLAGDLTVVAPGGLAPGVETRLAGLADREAAGSGTWRIHDASLRRAFDEGHTAEDVLEFLRRHSSTPLSQALEYLVADVARRHGRLRVGGATTYLRGDPAMVAGAVRSAAGRRLGLRELAPGVAVTGRSQRELLAALRKAGEAPLAEEPDGSPRPEGARPVRHVQRAAPDRLGPAGTVPNGHAADGPGMDPATVVDRLRGRRPVPATGTDQRVARG
ncbi:MAG TPA: helicase-associated domain-containing protein [Actinomycetota bacterium]|nr:helicase-associated domain-containing protein [Actinomycetota bacterium]